MSHQSKVVKRSVAIALGIICVVLGASLGVVLFIDYSPTFGSSVPSLQKQINDLNATYNDLNATYNDYRNTHHQTDSDYNSLQDEITNLLNQVSSLQNESGMLQNQVDSLHDQLNDFTNIVSLTRSTVWVDNQTVSQPASGFGGFFINWVFPASYAGFVSFNVLSSTTDSTYVGVVYSSYGVNYDSKIKVGTNGTAVFPVLPSSSIEVEIGYLGNLINGATETVTITYYY